MPASTMACFYAARLAWNPTGVDIIPLEKLGDAHRGGEARGATVLLLKDFQGKANVITHPLARSSDL
jgi:hypothetical protein